MKINVDVRHLRVVLAVMDSGSYTAAAQALHVAQSSISRTVLEVERRLETRLFERTTRRVVPTPEGRHFAVEARRVLNQFESSLNHFNGYLEGTRGAVSVATLASLAATLLPPILSRYSRDRPNVTLSVQDAFYGEVLERVYAGTVDFAIAAMPDARSDLQAEPLAADSFSCIFPASHRFTSKSRISWKDFEGEPFIAFDASSSIRTCVDQALSASGVTLGSVLGARDIGAVAGLTAAGLGVSIVPALVLPMVRFAGLRHRVITSPVVERSICLVRDSSRPITPAAEDLMQILRESARADIELPGGTRWIVQEA